MHGEQFSEKNIYRKLLIFYYNSRPYELKFLLVLSLNPRRVYEAILKPVFAAKKITFGQIKWKEKRIILAMSIMLLGSGNICWGWHWVSQELLQKQRWMTT